ncbi:MAG: M67 family peptidase [Candidatus Lokiarchaeota archaeon]|nr:M67 family peptidase [Candidatus Lokiarchaeota archaeon]
MFETIKGINLKKALLNEMIKFAKKSYPTEAVMLLFGQISQDWAFLEVLEPMKNIRDSPITFEIDPEEFYKIYLKNEDANRKFIGIFHSHPAPSYPSQIDIPNMKVNQVIWLILGGSIAESDFAFKNIKGYIWRNDSVQEVEIQII